VTKLNGKKRWTEGPKGSLTRLQHAEILADSLHNSVKYYLDHFEYLTPKKLALIEIKASKVLGCFRSLLAPFWKDKKAQLQLKRWINPAPNQVTVEQEAGEP